MGAQFTLSLMVIKLTARHSLIAVVLLLVGACSEDAETPQPAAEAATASATHTGTGQIPTGAASPPATGPVETQPAPTLTATSTETSPEPTQPPVEGPESTSTVPSPSDSAPSETDGAAGGGGMPSGGAGGMGSGGAADGLGGSGGNMSEEPGESVRSSGCGAAPELSPGEWSPQPDATIESTPREWAIRLPNDYDPERAYPLIVLLHGCTSGTNNVPLDREHGADAVYVRGTGVAANTCWNTSANGPNLEFFDVMVDGAADAACVDENRIFAAGYSSGSWLISVLACHRGDRLRAAGTVAGGNALFGNADCPGTIAQIFIHDQNDTENQWSGHESAMNRLLEVNGCSEDEPVPEDPEPCVLYQGCEENPVKFCPTTGRGHDRQDNYAPDAMWDFFSQF